MYQVECFTKIAEKDDYLEGCDPETTFAVSFDIKFKDNSICNLISSILEHFEVKEYSIISEDVIEFSRLENNEGYVPSKSELERWKKGSGGIWNANYQCEIFEVSPVNVLMEITKENRGK